MARVSFTVYKGSVLATVCSTFGSIFAFIGASLLVTSLVNRGRSEDITGGIVCLILGIGLALLSIPISERKEFKVWKKKLKASGMATMLEFDVDLAIRAYHSNPGKRTLKYIRRENPEAARRIAEEQAAKKKSPK